MSSIKAEITECSPTKTASVTIRAKDYHDWQEREFMERSTKIKGLFVVRKSKNKYLNGQKIRIIVDEKFGK